MYQTSVQKNSPLVVDAQYCLGMAHFFLQHCEQTKKYLEPLFNQFSKDGGRYYALGVCYLATEPVDVKKARINILKAQELGIEISAEVLAAIKETP